MKHIAYSFALILLLTALPPDSQAAWPLGTPQVDVTRDGKNAHLTTRYTKKSDRAYFKVFVRVGNDIYVLYRSFKNDGAITYRKLSDENADYVREHLADYIFSPDTVFTITTPSGTVRLSMQGGRWVETPIGGSSSTSSGSSSSSSSGADEDPQDDDPVDDNDDHDGSDPLCRLTGTCGGSSSGSSSSSSSGGGSGSSGSSSSSGGSSSSTSSSSSSSSGSSSSGSSSSSSGSSSGGDGTCDTPKDWFLNPFNKNSVLHRPIGTGAQYADDNDPATEDWLQATSFGINRGVPFGKSLYEVDETDPIMRVNPRAMCDKVSGVPVSIRFPKEGLPVRTAMNHSGCPDGVIVIYDRTTGIPHQLRQYDWNNGAPLAGQYRTWDIKGLGHGVRPGDRIGTSASGVGAMFGLLRGFEANTAGHRIEHAMSISLPRKPTTDSAERCNVMISKDIVLPAVGRDKGASDPNQNTGHIPYGALLAIPQSVDIDSLGLSEPGKRYAKALQEYGMYLVDGGGCKSGNMRADQYVSDEVWDQLRSDIPKFYRHIRMVTNNTDVLSTPVAGGGTPIAPNCAVDAP